MAAQSPNSLARVFQLQREIEIANPEITKFEAFQRANAQARQLELSESQRRPPGQALALDTAQRSHPTVASPLVQTAPPVIAQPRPIAPIGAKGSQKPRPASPKARGNQKPFPASPRAEDTPSQLPSPPRPKAYTSDPSSVYGVNLTKEPSPSPSRSKPCTSDPSSAYVVTLGSFEGVVEAPLAPRLHPVERMDTPSSTASLPLPPPSAAIPHHATGMASGFETPSSRGSPILAPLVLDGSALQANTAYNVEKVLETDVDMGFGTEAQSNFENQVERSLKIDTETDIEANTTVPDILLLSAFTIPTSMAAASTPSPLTPSIAIYEDVFMPDYSSSQTAREAGGLTEARYPESMKTDIANLVRRHDTSAFSESSSSSPIIHGQDVIYREPLASSRMRALLKNTVIEIDDDDDHETLAQFKARLTELFRKQMMYVSGETAEPSTETTEMIEALVKEQVVEMLKRSTELANRRGVKTIAVHDLIFLYRHDKGKVSRLRTFLSWKDVRKNAKDAEDNKGADAGDGIDFDDSAALPGTGPTDSKVPKSKKAKLVLPWEVESFYNVSVPERDDEEDNEDEEEQNEATLARLAAADERTKNMTKDEYVFWSDCRQASFTFRKGKRFREWAGFGIVTDSKPNDDIVDILGFLTFEIVQVLTELALKVKEEEERRNAKGSKGAGGDAAGGEKKRKRDLNMLFEMPEVGRTPVEPRHIREAFRRTQISHNKHTFMRSGFQGIRQGLILI